MPKKKKVGGWDNDETAKDLGTDVDADNEDIEGDLEDKDLDEAPDDSEEEF